MVGSLGIASRSSTAIALLLAVALVPACGGDDGMMVLDSGPPPDDGGVDGGPPPDDGGPPPDDGGPPPTDAGSGYSETLCDPMADISDIRAGYTGTNLRETLEALAMRRYPIGLEFLRAQDDMQLLAWFGGSPPADFNMVLSRFEVAVHEGAHIWDFTNSPSGMHRYRMREDLFIDTRRLMNFPRNEILALHVDRATDFYDEVYLEGFSGTQGFNNLLDEYNAYTHSLATRFCVSDDLAGGRRTSARDGILTMMYYVELYLKVARTDHPDDYAEITGDPGHVEFIITNWDRAEFWLDITSTHPELSINADTISTWVYDPDNVMEIEMLRAL